jgi:hypothetical protein
MVEPLRHRQTKEAATDMLDLKSPRHTSTLPWLRKNVSERSKAASDWLASTLKRADWLFLRSRGLETLPKVPEVILSDLETPG